jgi:hypothetical protein
LESTTIDANRTIFRNQISISLELKGLQGTLRVVQQVEEGHLSPSAAAAQAFPLELIELFMRLLYVVPRSVLSGTEAQSMDDEDLNEPEPPTPGDVSA